MMAVMALTSLSVIMAVLVINCYNGGQLSRRAPLWARSLVLGSLSKLLRMSHDTDRLAARLKLVDVFFKNRLDSEVPYFIKVLFKCLQRIVLPVAYLGGALAPSLELKKLVLIFNVNEKLW